MGNTTNLQNCQKKALKLQYAISCAINEYRRIAKVSEPGGWWVIIIITITHVGAWHCRCQQSAGHIVTGTQLTMDYGKFTMRKSSTSTVKFEIITKSIANNFTLPSQMVS
jgi:hypothetical protein